jgi:hypothetical protein
MIMLEGVKKLLPNYLLHVTAVPHTESPSLIWSLVAGNLFLVIAGYVFIYKLFKQKNIRISGITFGIALLLNYILVVIYGTIFDLLG